MTFDLDMCRRDTLEQNMDTGYDCDFVDGPPKELHWECAVCLLTLRQPYLVDCCGHHFCKACLDKISEENKKICPLCKHEEFVSIPNKGLERVLNQRKVYCTHKKNGCEWSGELRELDSHLNNPTATAKASSPSGTASRGSRNQLLSPDKTDPLLEGCQFVEVRCHNCPAIVHRGQMKNHLDICPNKPVKCKYCKIFTATPKELEESHHPVCPKFPVACPNKCGAKIQRKNVAKHVDTTCPLGKLQCEYRYVGCTDELPRKKMESHMTSASGMATHLSLMEKAYTALKQSKSEGGKDRGELAQRMKSLEQEKKALEADHVFEVERLSRKNAALEEKVQSLSAQIRRLDAENQRLKAKLNDYYKSSYDSDSDDIDYGASYAPSSTSYRYDSYSSKPSHSSAGYSASSSASYKSSSKSSTSYARRPEPKKTEDSGMGWGTALRIVGLGLAGAVGAATLMSKSSSSDDEKKSKKDSSWF